MHHVPHTRTWLLDCFYSWLRHSGASTQHRAFVLVGGPGVGKSAFSALLCKQLELVAARFFVSQGVVDVAQKRSPKQLLRTIAHQLAKRLPGARDVYERAVSHLGNVDALDVATLFDLLLRQPLAHMEEKGLAPAHPAVVVIDGLDALDPKDGLEDLLRLLKSGLSRDLPPWVRLFITTRKKDDLDRFHVELFKVGGMTKTCCGICLLWKHCCCMSTCCKNLARAVETQFVANFYQLKPNLMKADEPSVSAVAVATDSGC